MHDPEFHLLLDTLGYDRAGYRKVRKGVKKRIARHMQAIGARTMSDYLSALDANPALQRKCERLLTVSISRFFRDRRLWDRLPHLLRSAAGRGRSARLRIWSAGCAGGEEVYSLRILAWQLRNAGFGLPVLRILATDKNPGNLRRAKKGRYPAGSLKELPPEAVADCFSPLRGGRRFEILPFLKQDIEWRCEDLLKTLPDEGFDAIFLRNSLLTYYPETDRIDKLAGILQRLETGGFLVVGSHERLPEGFPCMVRDQGHPHIYIRGARRRESAGKLGGSEARKLKKESRAAFRHPGFPAFKHPSIIAF